MGHLLNAKTDRIPNLGYHGRLRHWLVSDQGAHIRSEDHCFRAYRLGNITGIGVGKMNCFPVVRILQPGLAHFDYVLHPINDQEQILELHIDDRRLLPIYADQRLRLALRV